MTRIVLPILLSLSPVVLSLVACSPKPPPENIVAAPLEPELISRELLLGNPTRHRGRISPDGTRVSYRAPVDGVMNVWVGPVDDPDAVRPVTRDTGRGIAVYDWSLDGAHILYVQDRGGDENFHLYRVDLETGEEIDLTPFEGVQAQLLTQSERHPGVVAVGINDRDPRWHDVYRIELETGERTLLAENEGFQAMQIDHDLGVRTATRPTEDGGFVLLERQEGSWMELTTIPGEDGQTTRILGFDGAGDGLYLIDTRDRDTAALTRFDLSSRETEVIVEEMPGADVTDVLFDPRTHHPVAYSRNRIRRKWSAIDPAFADDFTALDEGDLQIVTTTLDGSKWVLYVETGGVPEYRLWDRESRTLETLFSTRPDLERAPLATMHGLEIPSRDGWDLVSYLTLPIDSDPDGDARPTEPVPMVLFVHGGPWDRDIYGFSGHAQWLANRGYAILQVNFRASTGFGKTFLNAGNREWGAAMHEDLLDAVQWAVAEGITSPDQVAIFGGSYGGYATLVGLSFTPETFACGVDLVGPANLETLLGSVPPYWTWMRRFFARAMGDPETEEGRALLAERSPLGRVDQIVRPLLIGQGANDPRVNQAESDMIVEAMKANGLPVTYLLYPDEGHNFQKPENSLSFMAVTEAFLGECLGGRVEPIGDDFLGSSVQVLEGADLVPGLVEAVQTTAPKT